MKHILTSFFTAVCGMLLLTSCATNTGYYHNLNSMVGEKRYPEAASLVESEKMNSYGEKSALVYYMDLGFMQHLSGQYEASNESFEKAKQIADELFTKSITTEMSTWLVSDNMRPYAGEDFERAMINIFSALNYAFMGKYEDALVEARQVDAFLTKLQTDTGTKNVYKEDAFARYLMGMLQENNGDLNDAYISYYQALKAYKEGYRYFHCTAPAELVSDALKLAKKLGMNDDIGELKKLAGSGEYIVPAGQGELVLFDYNGFAPEKVDTFFEIALGKAWIHVEASKPKGEDAEKVADARAIAKSVLANDMIRIAFPKYDDVPYDIATVEAQAVDVGGPIIQGTLADDLGSVAKVNLDDRINRIRIKAIVRSALKYTLAVKGSEMIRQQYGEMAGKLAKKAAVATLMTLEKSDKRSWRSLPDKILVVRMPLPAGTHTIKLKFRDKNGSAVAEQTMDNIVIKANKKTFAAVRSAR